jgi:hypothetical protein
MIRITQASLYVAAVTHPGLAGRSNEDRYAVSSYQVSETDPTPFYRMALAGTRPGK